MKTKSIIFMTLILSTLVSRTCPAEMIMPDDWPYTAEESELWEAVQLFEAWESVAAETAPTEIIVGVVDSGVDPTHSDLAPVLLPGWNFIDNNSDISDDSGHGTKVSGLIAAIGDNAQGTVGMAWLSNVKLMPLRAMQRSLLDTSGDPETAARAIRYAVDNGADIINLSWGTYKNISLLETAIAYAEQQGVLIIASAGNDGLDTDIRPHFPSIYNYDNIICVTALDHNSSTELWQYANFGELSVDVAAPGVGLYSITVADDAPFVSGTSMATAVACGIAAMTWAQNPALDARQIRQRILKASSLPQDASPDLIMCGGVINAYAALMGIENRTLLAEGNPSYPLDLRAALAAQDDSDCFIQSALANSF